MPAAGSKPSSRAAWLTSLLAIGGVLESATGLGLLVAPAVLADILLRSPLTGAGLIVARLGGAGLLALGIACWQVRGTPTEAAGLGVARAFLVYNVVACVILALACPPLPGGLAALGASALHGLLAAGLLATLFGPLGPLAKP